MTIIEARKYIGQKKLGFGSSFDGSAEDYRELQPQDQVNLAYETALYIVANPSLFTPEQVKVSARFTQSGSNPPLEDTSFDFSMFGDEILNNAREINPFDPQNIKTVGAYLLVTAFLLGVAYIYINKKTV